jgi:Alanine-zipper, major outer membrane lipoprotein
MNAAVVTQVVISLGLVITAFLGGIFSRRTQRVTAEVTLSVEAREWAKTFEDRAGKAEARAERAEQTALEATRQARSCQDRMDLLERHVDKLEGMMRMEGLTPPPRPFQ